MRIVDYRAAVASAIFAKLPDLKECRPYAGRFDLTELKNITTRCPAIFVAVLGSRDNGAYGDGRRAVALNLAAYVVTMDQPGTDRDIAALNLCEILQGWIPHQRFGTDDCADAGEVRFDNLYSGSLRGQAIALMAVTWQQLLVIGEPCDPEPGPPVPGTVWLGQAPLIGLGNEEYYQEVTSNG